MMIIETDFVNDNDKKLNDISENWWLLKCCNVTENN